MQQQQQQQLPPPPQHPPPQGGGGGEFYRGPPMRQLSAASSTNLTPEYAGHPGPSPPQHQPPYDAYGDSFGAKRMRKPVQRRTVDYTSSVVRYVQARMWQRDARDRFTLQPTPAAVLDVLALTCNYVFKRWIDSCARNTDWSKLWKIVTVL